MYNAVSGETVTYTYDSLNRLLTATGNGWGEQYGFDSFGNLLTKTVTSGSGPSLSQTVNPANNQIQGVSGLTYDVNGNTTGTFTNGLNCELLYDPKNRLSSVYYSAQGTTLVSYLYDAQNRRIWSWPGTLSSGYTTGYTVNAYSPSGQKLGAYLFTTNASSMSATLTSSDQYFGTRRLAVLDQLGSAGTCYLVGRGQGQHKSAGRPELRDLLAGFREWARLRAESLLLQCVRKVHDTGPLSSQRWTEHSTELDQILLHDR